MSKTTRREFLIASAPLIAAPLLLPMLPGTAIAADQAEWRFCNKCFSLFFNGFGDNKGRCAAGGAHTAQGFSFHLPFNVAATATAQSDWRFCNKCLGLFWNGVADKGRCAAGGGHNMYGFDYVPQHSVNPNATNQHNWRFCQKCKAMFWDGAPTKGGCPAGAGHSAQGFMFVLRHDPPTPEFRVRTELHTDGWAPISGWAEITANSNGDFTWSGHVRNSGAINIRFTLIFALISPSGEAYIFTIANKRLDGTEVLIERDRNFNWNEQKNAVSSIARKWSDFSRSRLTTKLVASSAVGSGLTNFAEKIVGEAYSALPEQTGKGMFLRPPLVFLLNL